MSEIKWAYDEQTGTFSALPASPFLLVAIGFLCFLPFLKQGYEKYQSKPKPLPKNFDKELHDKYATRYKQLRAKQQTVGLTTTEKVELQHIEKPPWAKPGEYWHYR